MSKSIHIVFIKQKPELEYGTLYIRTIENRITKKKSTKIKITESEYKNYFNSETERFRQNKKFPNYEEFNEILNKLVEELSSYGNEIDNLPNERKSFIDYWKHCIENYTNHGTKLKHITVLRKLVKYYKSIDYTDLLFVDITPIFLRELRHYLTTVKDPKILSENTVIHYLKIIKSVINQSTSDNYFTYLKSPFNGMRFSMNKKSKSVLSEEEINKLLNTNIENKDIKKTREMFLFQVFSNGMRVSDLFLLRWNNFINGRMKYVMFKTGTEISIPINLNMGIILSELLGMNVKYDNIVTTKKIKFKDEENIYYDIGLKKLNQLIENLLTPVITRFRSTEKWYYEEQKELDKNMGKLIEFKGYWIDPSNTMIKNYIDLKENLILQIESEFLEKLNLEIKKRKQSNGKDFVFPVLSNSFFEDINEKNEFSKISEPQYTRVKHQTIVYDRKLKKVQKECDIETNITSHVSRHSYTNLLLRLDNVNLYDISQSLGHSNIKITENYLKSGFNIEKVDYLNNTISKKYRKK